MLTTLVKSYSNRLLREAAKNLCIWALNDVNSGCICGSYHNSKKQNFFSASGVTFIKNKNFIKLSTYAPALDCDPSISFSNSVTTLDESGKEFLEKHGIKVKGSDIPQPILSVENAGFPDFVNSVLNSRNVTTPTPIQSVSWPVVLNGRDFVGISPTGSGKTLGFAIPALIHVEKLMSQNENRNRQSPLAMVLTPTRELAQQIQKVFNWFRNSQIKCVTVCGGHRKELQLQKIYRGVDILIATPGRCYDLYQNGDINLDKCSFLVLDEADRMLDMGFLPQIEPIIENISAKRQVLMWSATWPKEVISIASRFLSDYIFVSVGSVVLKPNENVTQNIVMCNSVRDKKEKFLTFLEEVTATKNSKILIFAERKSDVRTLESFLLQRGYKVTSIHGNKNQIQRDSSLRNFHRGAVNILIATAVAARGIDVNDITHVINYDCPQFSDDYIHKIGRTGRCDKTGVAITYVTPEDHNAGYLVDMLKQCRQEVPEELWKYSKTFNLTRHNLPPKEKRFETFTRNFRQRHLPRRFYNKKEDDF